jgi:predicted DNA-binding WGR domain protein
MAAKLRVKAKAKGVAKGKASGGAGGRKLPRSAGSVAPISGLADKGKVYKEGSEVFDIDLNIRDAAKNMDKFYRMQVVEANDKKKYWFVQHWGRTGTSGQVQIKGPSSKDAAVKALKSKFRQKSGKDWANRAAAGAGTADSGARGGKGHYEMTSRLKRAGAKFAKVKGSVAISLMWDNKSNTVRNDLDLHVTPPSGEKIWFRHKVSKCGGQLDVDRMMHTDRPVENIVWTKKAPKGTYKVKVVNVLSSGHKASVPFHVGIVKDGGQMNMIDKVMPPKEKTSISVATFKYP